MVRSIGDVATNIFLISHREVDETEFDRVWEFAKPKNFTQYVERSN